jgi:hypothetical protein
MADQLYIAIALTFISFSAPITASIVMRGRNGNGNVTNGKYVTTREYDSFKAELGDQFTKFEGKIDSLHNYVKSRLP